MDQIVEEKYIQVSNVLGRDPAVEQSPLGHLQCPLELIYINPNLWGCQDTKT